MKRIKLTKVFEGESQIIGTYDSKPEAANEMQEIIDDNNENLDDDDECFLTPFDFKIEEVENYNDAKRCLGLDPQKQLVTIEEVNPKHKKALIALNALFTIAEAWNKADKFVPDFSNRNQYKWFTWFRYSDDAAGFVSASSDCTASVAGANFGSRLCFKSEERAEQFGKQFVDLWNDFLLYR